MAEVIREVGEQLLKSATRPSSTMPSQKEIKELSLTDKENDHMDSEANDTKSGGESAPQVCSFFRFAISCRFVY